MPKTDRLQGFLRIFEMPEFVKSWIDRFFEEIEIDLVMRLANRPLTRKEINRAFSSRFKPDPWDINSDLATCAYRKGIINLRDDNRGNNHSSTPNMFYCMKQRNSWNLRSMFTLYPATVDP